MSEFTWQNEWFTWSLLLGSGFPILAILLGELVHRLERQQNPLAGTFGFVRNFFLPILIFLLLVQFVFELDPESNFVKIVQTLFWICTINAALSLVNAFLFGKAQAGSWRARMPKLLIDLARLMLILLGTAIVLAAVWDADLAGLVTALGVGSVVIGLALQDTVGSVVSGIALLFERPFNVGDWLQVNGVIGQVVDINWRAVRLQSRSNDEVVVLPHKVIGGQLIRNYSQPTLMHTEKIQIGFSYDDPPNLVKQVLQDTALETIGVLSHPKPVSSIVSYDESAIVYQIRFHTATFDNLPIIDDFLTRVWYSVRRHHLKPYRMKYFVDYNPHLPIAPKSESIAEILQSIPLFLPLLKEASDLQFLAKEITLQKFGSGERIIREGDLVGAFYVIVSGQARMTTIDGYSKEREVLTLSRNDFFGTVFLGAIDPSQVSVLAATDLEVLVIQADALSRIFQKQSSLARNIGQQLEIRRKAILQAKQDDDGMLLNAQSGNASAARWTLEGLMRQVSYFQKFSDAELHQLIDQGYRKTLNSGALIYKENDLGDALYIILSGSVEVFVESTGKRVAIRRSGEFMGELSLLLGMPHSATLRTLGKTVLFVVDRKNLQSLLKKHPNLVDSIAEELSQRQDTLEQVGIPGSNEEEETAVAQVRQRIKTIFEI